MLEKKARVSNRKEDQQFEERKARESGNFQHKSSVGARGQNSFGAQIDNGDAHMPIKALNQFNTDWCIKARVLKKAPLRSYRNAKGEGVILNLDLIDREGTMIQATAFGETANKLNEQVE